MASLMSRFVESGAGPVEVDGDLVYPMCTTAINQGDRVQVSWLSAASPRVQGVTLRLRVPERRGRKGEGGLLRPDHVEAPALILGWTLRPRL